MTNKSVLIVDDSEIDNLISERIITMLGVAGKIYKAYNGREAMIILQNKIAAEIKLPDLILLDLNMHVLDGFGFLEEFKQADFPNKHNIEIVILSSSSAYAERQRAEMLGAKHYLTKPIDGNKLKSILINSIV